MILDRAKRATPSALIQPGQSSTAPLRLAHSAPGDGAGGVAAFPRRPIAFLWHYIRRRPLLHFGALASVLLAASCACAAQYGLKMIVDAMAQGVDHIAVAWRALAVFAGLLVEKGCFGVLAAGSAIAPYLSTRRRPNSICSTT